MRGSNYPERTMQTTINTNVELALQALASDANFASALATFFPADAPADVIANAVVDGALSELWKGCAAA